MLCFSCQNFYGADEPTGLPLQLHEEVAVHRAGEDAGGRHRHHNEVHPVSAVESHRRVAQNMQGTSTDA